jgi:hypothetical protein
MEASQPVGGTRRQRRDRESGKPACKKQDVGKHGSLLGLVCPMGAAQARKAAIWK